MRPSIQAIAELLSGFIFGLGLIVSGMSNPNKVQGFLDISGLWDPSLMFVMGGAIGVAFIPFYLIKKNPQTLFGSIIKLPSTNLLNKQLIIGNAIFGIGWGLAGICPGPALVSLGAGIPKAAIFVVGIIAGTKFTQIAIKKISA